MLINAIAIKPITTKAKIPFHIHPSTLIILL